MPGGSEDYQHKKKGQEKKLTKNKTKRKTEQHKTENQTMVITTRYQVKPNSQVAIQNLQNLFLSIVSVQTVMISKSGHTK